MKIKKTRENGHRRRHVETYRLHFPPHLKPPSEFKKNAVTRVEWVGHGQREGTSSGGNTKQHKFTVSKKNVVPQEVGGRHPRGLRKKENKT